MKLIIDIDEETYIKANAGILGSLGEIIANGTPLPKGHGRLIDADKVAEEIEEYRMGTDKLSYADLSNAENFNCGIDNALSDIKDAPTIIEADRGEEV